MIGGPAKLQLIVLKSFRGFQKVHLCSLPILLGFFFSCLCNDFFVHFFGFRHAEDEQVFFPELLQCFCILSAQYEEIINEGKSKLVL